MTGGRECYATTITCQFAVQGLQAHLESPRDARDSLNRDVVIAVRRKPDILSGLVTSTSTRILVQTKNLEPVTRGLTGCLGPRRRRWQPLPDRGQRLRRDAGPQATTSVNAARANDGTRGRDCLII
jgi:hypothetical protein